jgi:von Willebrand factor type A domain
MKKRKTIYHLIVDKSGSMSDCIDSTINGFNEQVNRIKLKGIEFEEEEITMGLTTFNTHVDHNYFQSNPSTIQLLNHVTYRPDGSTALLDAIGDSITQISIQTQSSRLPTTVVVVILTDGHENASRLFNLVKIRNMISSLEESGKWTFSFIGATLDAVDVAESMSIKKQNSFSFEKGEMNNSVWNKLDKSMNNYFEKKKTNRNLDNLFEE